MKSSKGDSEITTKHIFTYMSLRTIRYFDSFSFFPFLSQRLFFSLQDGKSLKRTRQNGNADDIHVFEHGEPPKLKKRKVRIGQILVN